MLKTGDVPGTIIQPETAQQAADDDLLFFTLVLKAKKLYSRNAMILYKFVVKKTHAINKHEHRKPYENAGMQK
jgi:hypothetical protein